MFRTNRRSIATLLAFLAPLSLATAAVTFELSFPDVVNHTGERWDDTTYGSRARATLQAIVNDAGRNFSDNGAIQLVITSSMTTAYGAGAYTAANQLEPGGRFYDGGAYVKIRRGIDINDATADGGIEYSFNFAGLHYSDFNGDGVVDMQDFIQNLKGLTRHELMHIFGLVSGIDPAAPANSRVTRHDTFLFDSAGRRLVKADGSVSTTANLNDAAAYFDPVGSGPAYQINHGGDFSHLVGITFPFRELINRDDRIYLSTLGYPLAPPAAKLLNIGTRGQVRGDSGALIGGFIVSGTEPKQLVIRGIGPSLVRSGVAGALADPTLEVYRGSDLFTANNDWKDNQRAELEATGLQPTRDKEAATIRTFAPGAYTAIVRGQKDTTGVAAVEVYDLSPDSDATLVNLSTRGFVGTGDDVMIGGVIVGDPGSRKAQLLIRALGPSLTAAGVSDAMGDPVLSLYDSNGTKIAENDNWRDSQEAALQASGFAPRRNKEAALLVSRPPGNTTAIVRGKQQTAGSALIEIYQLR